MYDASNRFGDVLSTARLWALFYRKRQIEGYKGDALALVRTYPETLGLAYLK
jgi:hypothetical protein